MARTRGVRHVSAAKRSSGPGATVSSSTVPQADQNESPSLDPPQRDPPQTSVSSGSLGSVFSDATGSTAQPESRRTLQISEAIQILSEFNGTNITINQFARECRDLESLLSPNDKYIFARIVKSKITGTARNYVNSKTYSNVTEILDELKRAYAPYQNLYRLQTELSTSVQQPYETVSDFGLRIVQNLNKTLDIIREDFEGYLAKGMLGGTVKNSIHGFIRGLRTE